MVICGPDLHILDGFVPQMQNMVPEHEFIGIEEVGSWVYKRCFMYIDHLIRLIQEGKVVLNDIIIITHTLPLADAVHKYEILKKKIIA